MRRLLTTGEPISKGSPLELLRRGKISFEAFERATRPRWLALARNLHGRWGKGSGVDVEDLYQEILLAIWKFLPRWDPNKASLDRFIRYNAADKAKKYLHVQRGAKRSGNADANPSRRELLEFDNQGDKTTVRCDPLVCVVEAEEIVLDLSRGEGARFERIMRRLSQTGSAEMVAGELYADPETRRLYHLCCEDHAVRVVRTVLRRAAVIAATRVAAQ